jgi:predicted MFS family arabinose efflux permease
VGAAISAVGAILQFSATSFAQLMVGRTINGFGNGMFDSFSKWTGLMRS